MPSIAELLNRSRQELLDLSTRNRLLSIPKSKLTRVVHVLDELSAEVFRRLVVDKKALSFLPGKKSESTNDQLDLGHQQALDDDTVGLPQPEEVEDGDSRSRCPHLRVQGHKRCAQRNNFEPTHSASQVRQC